jgi:protein-tyrosine phosphatase
VEALCNAEIARRLGVSFEALNAGGVRAVSAGLSVRPGESMAVGARHALEQLHVPVFDHSSQELTSELVGKAELIYCMTEAQRRSVIEAFPESSLKTRCMRTGADLEGPDETSTEGILAWTKHVKGITSKLVDQMICGSPK